MIKIEKIEFSNYRQYRHITIDFKNNSDCNIHILKAKNGTGKTTFLNGILWCLYEKEYYISDKSKALPIVNEKAITESNPGDVLETRVKLTISDDDKKQIIFERFLKFSVTVNPLDNKNYKRAIKTTPTAVLKVYEIPMDNPSNAIVYESYEDTKSIVKQYFDEDIYTYYFFNGENLKNYFDSSNSEKVKKSIYTLSQVNLLQDAATKTETMSTDKSRELTKKKDQNDVTIYDKIDKLEDENERFENENKTLNAEIPVIELRINSLNDQLNGYKPIQDKQARREELDRKYKRLKLEQDEFISKKKEFIRTYLMLFNLYPRIKSTLDMIKYKEEHGELPPRIDKKQIEELINNHDVNCPMCDGEINDHAIRHMQELLEELEVSSQASNYLSSIKGGLENAITKCKKYSKERQSIIENEKYYANELSKTEAELNTISKYLSTYIDEGNGLFDVPKLEKARSDAKNELTTKQRRLWDNENLIKMNNDKLEEMRKEVKEMEKNASEKRILQKQVSIYRQLSSAFKDVKKSLMDEIKIEIEKNTWESFKNMIWKKNTFFKLEIDDTYQMAIFDYHMNEMIGSISETEKMALAYAFTLAVHETSGRNCPLVVDSPLGRVSDDNRTKMTTVLKKISKDKQIIMLFTPDEYSKEVADIFDRIVSSKRDLSLSDDESEIKRLEN